jgi:hypothetical protein
MWSSTRRAGARSPGLADRITAGKPGLGSKIKTILSVDLVPCRASMPAAAW